MCASPRVWLSSEPPPKRFNKHCFLERNPATGKKTNPQGRCVLNDVQGSNPCAGALSCWDEFGWLFNHKTLISNFLPVPGHSVFEK